MTFSTIAVTHARALVSALGDVGTLTPKATPLATYSLGAILDRDVEALEEGSGMVERVNTISVVSEDMVARLVVGDLWTFGGRDYTVQELLSDDGIVSRYRVG